MRIKHSSEDDYLQELIEDSYEDIKSKCGTFTLGSDKRGTELVYERSRYAYNDALEFFNENFLSQINSFAFDNLDEDGEVDA